MERKKPRESYPIRSIRLSKATWEAFKDMRWESKENWEQFIKQLTNNDQIRKSIKRI